MIPSAGNLLNWITVALVATVKDAAVDIEENIMVRTRDGVTIETYVKKPPGNGPWPAVLQKGYRIITGGEETFTQAGYA